MSPRHFSNLRHSDPVAYQKGEDKFWNTFVSITHTIGLSHFFSFTPEFLEEHKAQQAEGRFAKGEIPGDK